MSYLGAGAIPGLSVRQQAACESAAGAAPDPTWRDGIMRAIAERLGDPPENGWSDITVAAAIRAACDDLGITTASGLL
jgi:hypothetical protein